MNDTEKKILFNNFSYNNKTENALFTVEFLEEIINNKDTKADGQIIYEHKVIQIRNVNIEQRQRLVILHEIWHGLDPNLSEEQVDKLSKNMYTFIRQNKEIAEMFLLSEEEFSLFNVPKKIIIGWAVYDLKVFEDGFKLKDDYKTKDMAIDNASRTILLSKMDYISAGSKRGLIESILSAYNIEDKLELTEKQTYDLASKIVDLVNNNKDLSKFIIEDDTTKRLEDFILGEIRCYSALEYAYGMVKTGIRYAEVSKDNTDKPYFELKDINKSNEFIQAILEFRKAKKLNDLCREDISVNLFDFIECLNLANSQIKEN
jgi:hypothetical protein